MTSHASGKPSNGDGPARREGSLILILGDQLSKSISSLQTATKNRDVILMVEVVEEATYVRHHKKKIAFLFSAMRHFAESLKEDGWRVDYTHLDDAENSGSFTGEIRRALDRHGCNEIIVTEPGEWRVAEMIRTWPDEFGIKVSVPNDDRFVCSHDDFATWAGSRKQLRMEYFYRDMRRRTDLLMQDDAPEGGRWNYDAENRKPRARRPCLPEAASGRAGRHNRRSTAPRRDRFGDHFGDLEPFWFAVTAQDAKAAFEQFVQTALPNFGDYQDAMLADERFVYHSVLSLYINAGLLDPLDVCRKVEAAYREGHAPLNAAEGFIRQIIGWREYVRGIYWLKMPEYRDENHFGATRLSRTSTGRPTPTWRACAPQSHRPRKRLTPTISKG